jgi:hypothetical protein
VTEVTEEDDDESGVCDRVVGGIAAVCPPNLSGVWRRPFHLPRSRLPLFALSSSSLFRVILSIALLLRFGINL